MTISSTEPTGTTLADEFEAALEWWKAAGVDHVYADDATDWLAPPAVAEKAETAHKAPAKTAAVPFTPTIKKIGGPAEEWPSELAAFQTWWTKSDTVDDGGAFSPIAPRGIEKAPIMILVAEPEEGDRDTLLAGSQGKLLSGMLRAAGLKDSQIYLASVLRRHTPMPDWAALRAAGLGDLLAHHIKLVGPERILAFGRNIPPLIGNDTAQGAAILQDFNHEGTSIPVMGAGSLPELLRSAPRRQRFWQRWLEWVG